MNHTPLTAEQSFADYVKHTLKCLDLTKAAAVSAHDVRGLDKERRELITEALSGLLDAQAKLQQAQALSLPARHLAE